MISHTSSALRRAIGLRDPALVRSLLHHNERVPLRLVVASDLPALQRLLDGSLSALPPRASVAVHALCLQSAPADVTATIWLASELLPRLRGLVALEPGALVLGLTPKMGFGPALASRCR